MSGKEIGIINEDIVFFDYDDTERKKTKDTFYGYEVFYRKRTFPMVGTVWTSIARKGCHIIYAQEHSYQDCFYKIRSEIKNKQEPSTHGNRAGDIEE